MRARPWLPWLLLLSGCDGGVEVVRPALECPPGRETPGGCCEAWQVAVDGACAERRTGDATTVAGEEAGLALLEVAVDGRGRITLVGADTGGVHLFDEAEDGSFDAPLALGALLEGVAQTPQIALGPGGAGVVAYRHSDGGSSTVRVALRPPGGLWREEPDPWSFGVDAYQPEVALAPSGDALVTWNQWVGEHYAVQVATSPSVDAPFSRPRDERDVLSPLVNFSNAPQPALGSDGSFVIAWYQAAEGPLLTYASERRGRDGEPTRPAPDEPLSAPGAPVDSNPTANPRAAMRDDGAAAVAWTQEDGRGGVRAYAATRDPDGTWHRPASLEDSLSVEGRASRAQIAFGATGDLWIAWQEELATTRRVRVAHRAADGTWGARGGAASIASSEGREAIEPVLAAGRDGTVALVFRERRADGTFAPALVRCVSGASTLGAVAYLAEDDVTSGPAVAVGGAEPERWAIAWASEGAARLVTID